TEFSDFWISYLNIRAFWFLLFGSCDLHHSYIIRNLAPHLRSMPTNANRQFLDFEKPIKDLIDEIENARHRQEKTKIDMGDLVSRLEQNILEKRKEITSNLTSWQRVQLSRHPDRPYTQKYIEKMTTHFVELFGDRNVKDDKAMIGGFASLDGETVMIVGLQKVINTNRRQMRNTDVQQPKGKR